MNGYYSDPRYEMIDYVPITGNKILDVGCGQGEFGRTLKQCRTVEVWGVEIIPEIASKAKVILDSVVVGNIEESQAMLPNYYFNCIVCNDVLEHLKDPWKVLVLLREKLAPGGCVVASIPNVRYFPNIKDLLLEGKWKYVNSGIIDITHLRFFTKSSIKEMYDISGYAIKKIEGIRKRRMSWKYELLNTLTLCKLNDMRYERFAVVAIPKP